MKILITYATGTGTTEKCANLLAEQLPGAEVVDLKKQITDPRPYDAVIVGGSIRGGVLSTEAQTYLDNCEELLLEKKLGLFICCSDQNVDALFESNVSEKLLAHAAAKMSFGGELAPERARGIEKFMLRFMARSARKNGAELRLHTGRIAEFAALIRDDN